MVVLVGIGGIVKAAVDAKIDPSGWLILLGIAVVLVVTWGLRRRTRVRMVNEYLALTPAQFESAIGDLFTDLGYVGVRRVGGAGDLGADLTARDQKGRSVVIQCKRYAPGSHVGSPVIQTFIGMMSVHHRADVGIVVTTSEFTTPARRLGEKHGILMVDRDRLAQLLEKAHAPRSGLMTRSLDGWIVLEMVMALVVVLQIGNIIWGGAGVEVEVAIAVVATGVGAGAETLRRRAKKAVGSGKAPRSTDPGAAGGGGTAR